MATKEEWVRRAEKRLVALLEEHHALVHAEAMARISEGAFQESGLNIDPHHVTAALRRLRRTGVLADHAAKTRGGREVATIQLADAGRQATRIQRAASRKRLLYARYAGWSQATKHHPHGLIGPAAETAVRGGLLASGVIRPIESGAAAVRTVLGTRLAGPVDSAGFYLPLDPSGIPGTPITVLVEVKNIRSWIYPDSPELFQLLCKCVVLQREHSDQPIIGLLACRRAHPRTVWMAKQLGFVVIELGAQFAGDVTASALDEVRVELALSDLRPGTGPSLRVRDRLTKGQLPRLLPELSSSWRQTAIDRQLGDAILAVGTAQTSAKARSLAVQVARLAKAAGHPGWDGSRRARRQRKLEVDPGNS